MPPFSSNYAVPVFHLIKSSIIYLNKGPVFEGPVFHPLFPRVISEYITSTSPA